MKIEMEQPYLSFSVTKKAWRCVAFFFFPYFLLLGIFQGFGFHFGVGQDMAFFGLMMNTTGGAGATTCIHGRWTTAKGNWYRNGVSIYGRTQFRIFLGRQSNTGHLILPWLPQLRAVGIDVRSTKYVQVVTKQQAQDAIDCDCVLPKGTTVHLEM